MTKKILLITLFTLFAGALIAGGVYRTSAKSAQETYSSSQNNSLALENHANNNHGQAAGSAIQQQQGEPQGQGLGNNGVGQGRNRMTGGETGLGNQGQNQSAQDPSDLGQGSQGNGQGRSGQAGGTGEIYMDHESLTITGVVSQAPALGVDMIVTTADNEEVLMGTGPGYLQEVGFELAAGDTVEVTGFWEDGEFKVETITCDGETVALRDEYGRPLWSGAARGGRGAGNQANSS